MDEVEGRQNDEVAAAEPVRGRAARADAAVYLAGTVAVAVLGLYVIRVAGQVLPEAGLGLLLVGRRIATSGANLLQLGMSQTLVRYVGMHRDSVRRKWMYVVIGSVYGVGAGALCLLCAHILREFLGAWLFPGIPESSGLLALCTAWLVVGTALGYVAHSTMLAERRLWWANVMRATDGGVLLAALLWFGTGAEPAQLLWYEGVGLAVIGVAILASYLALRRPGSAEPSASWREVGKECVTYAPSRGVTTFVDTLTLLIGPWLLRSDPVSAGHLTLALTLIRTMQGALAPVSKVCSAVTANLVGRHDEVGVAAGTRLVLGVCLYASLLATAFMVPLHRVLLDLWLGEPNLVHGTATLFMIVCWSLVPFLVFNGLKGMIEVLWTSPRNLQSLLLGLAVQLMAYHALRGPLGDASAAGVAIVLMFWAIGLTTAAWLWRHIGGWRYYGLGELLMAAGAIGGAGLIAAPNGGAVSLGAAALATGCVIALLGWRAPSPFAQDLRAFAMGRWRPTAQPAGEL